MPNWSTLLTEFEKQRTPEKKQAWAERRFNGLLTKIAARRDTNVIVYASGFLQKPMVPSLLTSISHEDMNGLMCTVNGLDFDKGLSLILHTPGGDMAATETIIDYLRSKFEYLETIVPMYAMSGGTMIALGSDLIVMGRQSQLGPIDAQIPLWNGTVSAYSIISQFRQAKEEILKDRNTAAAWAPILQ